MTKRNTTFTFTLVPTGCQVRDLWRHLGASRYAFNQTLRLVLEALEAKSSDSGVKVPWSGFDLINTFNAWKRTEAAGTDDEGRPGLPWRREVCQQVFEEAAVDLGRGLKAFSDSRKGARKGTGSRFPKFKKRTSSRQSFRLRNKVSKGVGTIRVGDKTRLRSVRLPKLGKIKVRECTRRLRRMLRGGRAKIWFATVSVRGDGVFVVTLNVQAEPFHECQRHSHKSQPVGIDRGLTTFAVVAGADGVEHARLHSPRPLRRQLKVLRRRSRAVSRKARGSRNRHRARRRLARTHQRIADIRREFLHRASSRLAKTHSHLVIEDLNTKGLMRTRLARSLADSAWARFGTMLEYKVRWRGGTLTLADRFYPSTQRCSACGQRGPKLGLGQRQFHCNDCGHQADRDTNAAVCIAQYPLIQLQTSPRSTRRP